MNVGRRCIVVFFAMHLLSYVLRTASIVAGVQNCLRSNVRVAYTVCMNLETYLKTAGLTQTAFASRVGVKHPTINRLVKGRALPSLRLAFLIEHASGGIVKATSWSPVEQAA